MGICVNKITCITSNKPPKALNHSFISDYYHNGSKNSHLNDASIVLNFNILTTAKSLLSQTAHSKHIISFAVQLIHNVCAAIKIENQANGSLYHSIEINRLSECKSKDEQRYLYYQNKVISDWSSNFADYYLKSQLLNKEVEDEKLSIIMSKKDLSTFTNEIVTEINNNIYNKTKDNDNDNSSKTIKKKTNSISIIRNKGKMIGQPKHKRFKSTNFTFGNPVMMSNQIRIDLNSLKDSNSPIRAVKNIKSPAFTDYNRRTKTKGFDISSLKEEAKDWGKNRRERKSSDKRVQTQKKASVNAFCLVNPNETSRNSKENSSFLTHSTFEDCLHQKLIMANAKQRNKIDTSPLNENKHVFNIEDMKRVLNDFKSKNMFLFQSKAKS